MGGGASFLGGLMGGFAQGIGSGIAEAREQKRELSDEERHGKVTQYQNIIDGLGAQAAQIPGGAKNPDPKLVAQYNDLQEQMAQNIMLQTNLFHPNEGPGAMQHLGRLALQFAQRSPAELEHVGRMVWHHHGTEQAPPAGAPQTAAVPGTAATPSTNLPSMSAMEPGLTVPGIPQQAATGITTPQLPAIPASRQYQPPPPAAPHRTPQQEKQYQSALQMARSMTAGAAQPNQFLQTYQQLGAIPGITPEQLKETVLGMAVGGGRAAAARTAAEKWKPTGKPIRDPQTGQFMQTQINAEGEYRDVPMKQALAEQMNQSPASRAQMENYIRSWFPNPTPMQREWAMNRYYMTQHPEITNMRETLSPPDAQGNVRIIPLYSQSHVPGQADQGAASDFWGELGPPPANADGSSSVPAHVASALGGAASTTPSAATPEQFRSNLQPYVPQAGGVGGVRPNRPAGGGAAPSAAPAAAAPAPALPGAAAPTGIRPPGARGPQIPSAESRLQNYRRATPAEQRAQGDALIAVRSGEQLVEMGKAALNAPETTDAERVAKASLQRGFIGVLQYTLEHRYNQQAREQLVGGYGIGGNVETFIYNRFGNGMVPPDIFQGLVGIANTTLKGAHTAYQKLQQMTSGGAAQPNQSDPNMPPQDVIDRMQENQYAHGPNGATYQKRNGVLVPVPAENP